MKKVGILTINDDNNYGNRLQNYATQEILKKRNLKVKTIVNLDNMQGINYWKWKVKNIIKKHWLFSSRFERYQNFMKFNQKIQYASGVIEPGHIPTRLARQYDYFVTGSDQVWNPDFGRMTEVDFLEFAPKEKRNSLSASFGISELPEEIKEKAKKGLEGLKNISVREERGKEIILELTGREDVEVLVDPTMMLEEEEWLKVAKKPKQLKNKKYILNYFLGKLSCERRKEIERVAKKNNCEIIDILEPNNPFYSSGPSEFLYLEKNAFLICTDSFHSCIFAILFQKPFLVFEREQENIKSMNSRIDTLLKTFSLTDRYFNGKITKEKLSLENPETKRILLREREKFTRFLDKIFEGEKEI